MRSGQATAAPVASGSPTPIAPPVSCSQSCGGAARPSPRDHVHAVGVRLVADDRPLGQRRRDRGRERGAGERRRSGASGPRRRRRPAPSAPTLVGELRPARRPASSRPVGQHVDLAALGDEVARLAGIGEERHRRAWRRRARGGGARRAAARPSPRSTGSSRSAGCRRRARCGRRTSRRTAGRRCRRRCGPPRAAARAASPTRRAAGRPARRSAAP